MRLRVFRGPDLASAMQSVRRTLGENGLILETREAGGGIEILAAADPADISADVPTSPEPLAIVPPRGSAASALRDSLASHGLSPAVVARLVEDDLAASLSATIRFGALPLESGGAPLVFAGEPGAGKTLSVIKIATRLVLGGHVPLVISADDRKAGAIEQLASMTRLLGLTVIVAHDADQLRRAIGRRASDAPVLIDAPGLDIFSASDRAALTEMRDASAAEIILVLPAGLDVGEASEMATEYAALGTERMLATRLDVARRLGGIVEPAFRSGLVLTEGGTAAGAAGGLAPLTPPSLADRLRAPARPSVRRLAATGTDRCLLDEQECSGDGLKRRHPADFGSR